jgi:hypothetical protein
MFKVSVEPNRPSPLVNGQTKTTQAANPLPQIQSGFIGDKIWNGRVKEPRAESYQLKFELKEE